MEQQGPHLLRVLHALGLNCTSLGGQWVDNQTAVAVTNLSFQAAPPSQGKRAWQVAKAYGILKPDGKAANRVTFYIIDGKVAHTDAAVKTETHGADIATKLKELGVRLALDDFGIGLSGVAHLRRLPLDRLKIDRSLVADMHKDADHNAVIAAIHGQTIALNARNRVGLARSENLRMARLCSLMGSIYRFPPTAAIDRHQSHLRQSVDARSAAAAATGPMTAKTSVSAVRNRNGGRNGAGSCTAA